MTEPQFADKVVLVTGAAGGIGAAAAAVFAREGARLVLFDRDSDGVRAVAGALTAADVTARGIDLRDEDALERGVGDVLDSYGRVDVLVNVAGLFVGTEGPVHELTRKEWDLSLDVNLRSAAKLSSLVLPAMVEAGGGAIVNVSSAQAQFADVAWASYGIAKAGVESLTRYIATQYGREGIRCNCVAPGFTATANAMARFPAERSAAIQANTPLGRFGEPYEQAEVIAFLASDRASFVSGQVLAVDGGMLAHLPAG